MMFNGCLGEPFLHPALAEIGEVTPEQIARRFMRARTTSVQPLLDSLAALGQAEKVEEGRYAA